MRIADENKRRRIMQAASRLFAATDFGDVTLASVAKAAGIGKATIYVYFKSKDDLYLALIYEGFAQLLEQLRRADGHRSLSPRQRLKQVVEAVARFSFDHPHFFELTRRVGVPVAAPVAERNRRELFGLIEAIIREGNRVGEFRDPRPDLTARFVPGLIRAALLHPIEGLTTAMLTNHIVRILTRGVGIEALEALAQA